MRDSRAAFAVHVLTASGAACAFFALLAATDGNWTAMFAWLGAALFIDGIDGPLARRANVVMLLPRWSGDTMDLVVDFLTYVFVPAFAITRSGLLPDTMVAPAAAAIVVSSALYFGDRKMKMDDNSFRGFPALWNAAAFYLILVSPPAWAATAAVTLLVIATFVPFRFIHPLRVRKGRMLNLAVLVLWSVLALVTLAHRMVPGPAVTIALCVIAAYFVIVGTLRHTIETGEP
jgi:phosphatidylcholine synthase